MIKTVFRFQNIVAVFDEWGKQISEYQGMYQNVRESILKDAPPEAVFVQGLGESTELVWLERERW